MLAEDPIKEVAYEGQDKGQGWWNVVARLICSLPTIEFFKEQTKEKTVGLDPKLIKLERG